MPLKVKVDTVSQLVRKWDNGSPEVRAVIRKDFKEFGKLLAAESAKRAPVDEGNLELSHTYKVTKDVRDRFQLTVFAGGTVKGVKVEKYVIRMHEGTYNLGPKSAAKNASQQEAVGPKFMDRALKDNIKFIEDYLLDTIFGAMK
jgi:hypothetical protein